MQEIWTSLLCSWFLDLTTIIINICWIRFNYINCSKQCYLSDGSTKFPIFFNWKIFPWSKMQISMHLLTCDISSFSLNATYILLRFPFLQLLEVSTISFFKILPTRISDFTAPSGTSLAACATRFYMLWKMNLSWVIHYLAPIYSLAKRCQLCS